MNKDLEDKLKQDFPLAFRDKRMYFATGDGWEPLIRECASKIESILQNRSQEELDEGFGITVQVKEKFGTLRFYCHGYDEEILKAIREAEDKSEITCERCGNPGTLRPGGWLKTLCDGCNEIRYKLNE